MVEAAAWEPRGVYSVTPEVARLSLSQWTSDYLWTCLSISGSARQHNLSLDIPSQSARNLDPILQVIGTVYRGYTHSRILTALPTTHWCMYLG